MKKRNKPLVTRIITACLGIILLSTAIYTLAGFPQHTTALTLPHQEGLLWAPYMEWSLDNATYSGNPFNLVADVTFTHAESGETRTTQMFYDGDDTWKFRFSGTRTGQWSFTTSSSDPDLDGHNGALTIQPNPDPNARGFVGNSGNKWMWTGSQEAFVPQLVMYRTPKFFHNQPSKIDEDIQTWFVEHGFNGLHVMVFCAWFDITISESEADGTQGGCNELNTTSPNPDIRTFEALELLITKAYQAGGMVHIWMWGDQGRRQTPIDLQGGKNGSVDRRLQRYIAARLGPIPGWTMGYGYDNWEWNNKSDQETWHEYMQSHFGWKHMLGVRWEKNQLTQATEVLDYASYEQHKPDYDTYVTTINRRPEKPAFSEDRFRGISSSSSSMYYSQEQIRRGLWHSMMAGGVANIWGIWSSSNRNTFWNEGGSYPFPNKAEIQTYARFVNGRFLADMEPANYLTNGYALKNASNNCYIFYRENTSSIQLNLSNMQGSSTAVAVDTKKPYAEINLGALSKTNQTWQAPYQSDWAIAVGDFRLAANTVESKPENQTTAPSVTNDATPLFLPIVLVSPPPSSCGS